MKGETSIYEKLSTVGGLMGVDDCVYLFDDRSGAG